MKRIALAKNATWGLAFLVGAGAFVFAMAFLVFPPRRPAPVRVAAPRDPVPPAQDLDMKRISKIWMNDLGQKPPTEMEKPPFEGAALAGTTNGPAGAMAAITLRDGSQALVSEKDSRITRIAPGNVTPKHGEPLTISRGHGR
ncbi:MAG: hypothetical protein HYY18_04960 [Planctomycetes bacterium]|nr:hypothetical protein [Planctomycetota bacterium]